MECPLFPLCGLDKTQSSGLLVLVIVGIIAAVIVPGVHAWRRKQKPPITPRVARGVTLDDFAQAGWVLSPGREILQRHLPQHRRLGTATAETIRASSNIRRTPSRSRRSPLTPTEEIVWASGSSRRTSSQSLRPPQTPMEERVWTHGNIHPPFSPSLRPFQGNVDPLPRSLAEPRPPYQDRARQVIRGTVRRARPNIQPTHQSTSSTAVAPDVPMHPLQTPS